VLLLLSHPLKSLLRHFSLKPLLRFYSLKTLLTLLLLIKLSDETFKELSIAFEERNFQKSKKLKEKHVAQNTFLE